MQKREVLCFVFALVLLVIVSGFVSASGIESEIAKLTNYAEEYETGNINYAQLMVYLSNAREKMNGVMGVMSKEDGGILKEEQLKNVLGAPNEKTRWVWNEKDMKEVRYRNDVPVWRKIVFDGNKIQIWLNAWPSLFDKKGNRELVYRLDVRVEFRKEGETGKESEITNGINEIKSLAENYNQNPSNENANELAKKSVSVEMKFQQIIKEGREKCEEFLSRILGSENKRVEQKTIVREIDFYQENNFDVIMRLEMCDECEWYWINLDFWIESRGMFKQPKEGRMEKMNINPEMSNEDFEGEIRNIVEEIRKKFEEGDYNSAYALKGKLMQLNEAWNQKSNNVWQDVDKVFQEKNNFDRSDNNNPERQDPYYWVKQEQEKRKMVNEIAKRNYQERKQFYLDLVSSYPKREYVFNKIEYEKRLVEIFGEFKQEQCSNNIDDNNDGNVDCLDEQCNGRICGEGEVEVQIGNETRKENRELFCIMKECKAREEIRAINEGICGNHICENGEQENCREDCSECKVYDAINCTGKVIFKGRDENNCPLEPICIEESLSCSATEDCFQPLCGKAECVEGKCVLQGLSECREAECNGGQEKVLKCGNEEIISEKCFDGVWRKTGAECERIGGERENVTEETREEIKEPGAGMQCVVKEDCGGADDVCSNGRCVTIPKAEIIAPVEPIAKEQEAEEQQTGLQSQEPATQIEQPTREQDSNDVPVSEIQQEVGRETPATLAEVITGNVVRAFFDVGGKITGFVITAFDVEGGESGGESVPVPEPAPGQSQEQSAQQGQPQQPFEETRPLPEGQPMPREGQTYRSDEVQREDEERRRQDDKQREDDNRQRMNEERQRGDEQRRAEDEKRRNEECNKNCDDNCERSVIVPCVQKCIFDSKCGINCDNEMESCKDKCKKEKDISGCRNDCSEKCKKGERFDMKQDNEMNKFEKAVFKAGGQCRVSDEKKEGGLWFDGWGEPFEGIRYLKQEYYNGGSDDWCKKELENYLKQRAEFEKSMNQEFLRWFFENHIANSAEGWEDHISGIFDIYWKDVDLSREIARTMGCSGLSDMSQFNPINIKYESEYGKVEFWEEIKNVKMPELGNVEMTVISPYMKVWVFPSKEFIVYEMKKAMKEHEFPGKGDEKTERKNQEGPTEEEKEQIKKDNGLMEMIRGMSGKYN